MARWRLREKHYLSVRVLPDGTDVVWEHKETSQQTGRTLRKVYHVPILLDPNAPGDCNYPDQIIVCYEGKGQPEDIIFEGEPTPDMEPLDAEAKKISDSFRDRWAHPIETINFESYGGALLQKLETMIQGLAKQPATPPNQEIAQLMQMVQDLQQEVTTLREAQAAAEERLEEVEENA